MTDVFSAMVMVNDVDPDHLNKSMDQLRKEIDELYVQQRELEARLNALPNQDSGEANEIRLALFILDDNHIDPRLTALGELEHQSGID